MNDNLVPKLFFTFWQGSNFSILHYYTIVSLYKYNPDVKVIVYTSSSNNEKLVDWNSGEHSIDIINRVQFESIRTINNNLSIVNIDFNSYGIDNDISVVFKADFVRIAKLFEHGGVWFDFDVLFIKPFPPELFSTPVDVYYFSYLNTIPTGLIFASPKTGILDKLFTCASKQIHESQGYQKLGPNLWCDVFLKYPELLNNSKFLPTNVAYPYNCNQIHELLNIPSLPILSNKKSNIKITNDTICIHWFNGDTRTRQFINQLNISHIEFKIFKSPLEIYLYRVIK